jgi:methyl-accepting chemotaxis protein
MQEPTVEAVGAIKNIGGTIGSINEIATAIALAIEQQDAATREIARNIQQAAEGTDQVSTNIVAVNDAASQTGLAAGNVLTSSEELGRQTEVLRTHVDTFLTNVRAA